jgi:hypothetical protein
MIQQMLPSLMHTQYERSFKQQLCPKYSRVSEFLTAFVANSNPASALTGLKCKGVQAGAVEERVLERSQIRSPFLVTSSRCTFVLFSELYEFLRNKTKPKLIEQFADSTVSSFQEDSDLVSFLPDVCSQPGHIFQVIYQRLTENNRFIDVTRKSSTANITSFCVT